MTITNHKTKLITALFICSFLNANEEVTVNNITTVDIVNGYKYLDISKTDANRIYCESGDITEIVYSEEKEINIQKIGQNAIVKLIPINEMQGEEVLSTTINSFTRETYITCDGKMYSLVLVPKDIQAQTIILKTPLTKEQSKRNNKKVEIVNEYQSVITELIKNGYKEENLDDFRTEYVNKRIADYKELSLTEYKKYNGETFNLQEFEIKANDKDINVDEKLFLPFFKNPIAISLEMFTIKANTTARMFVVTNAMPDSLTTEEENNLVTEFQKKTEKSTKE